MPTLGNIASLNKKGMRERREVLLLIPVFVLFVVELLLD